MMRLDVYKIVELLANVIEANIILLFVGVFLSKKEMVQKINVIIACSLGMGFICYLLDHTGIVSVFKTMFLLAGFIGVAYVIYRKSIMKTMLWITLYVAVFSPVEVMIIFIMQYFSGKELELFFIWSAERVYALIVIKIIEIFALIVCYKLHRTGRRIEINNKLIRIIVVTGALVIMMTMLFVMNHLTGNYEEMVTMAYFIFAVGLVLFLVYAMFSITENVQKQQELEMIRLHNEILQQSLQETKNAYMHWEKSIHDYKNTMICLDSMLKETDASAVRAYLDKEIKQIQCDGGFIDVGNDMVNSILNIKWVEAEQKNIYFSVKGEIEKVLPVDEISLGRLLGNLVDNAIEAAADSGTNPFVEAELYQRQGLLCINIINSAASAFIDFSKSSKKKSGIHGIGLKSVREKVEEHQGVFQIKQTDDIVEARVQIPFL